MKKVAIFTLPLINNYGGILQAYALSEILKSLEFEPILLNLKNKKLSKFSLLYLKFLIAKIFIKKYKNAIFKEIKQDENASKFIDKNFNLSEEIYSIKELRNYLKKEDFYAVILGSDQVLRPSFFGIFKDEISLSFLNEKVIKILYAGSFGGNFYDGKNEKFHSKNFAKFKALSVREKSGVKIFKDSFNLDAKFVLDPTILANKKIYSFAKGDFSDKIFAYILDPDEKKAKFLKEFSQKKSLEILEINDNTSNRASIEEWLGIIKSAKFILTDSFHGVIFSIIFHKEFFVFANEKRGNDRILSILEIFNLKNRLINNNNNFDFSNINWQEVDEILKIEKEKSLNFLKESLILIRDKK